jgi:hypothetical protein
MRTCGGIKGKKGHWDIAEKVSAVVLDPAALNTTLRMGTVLHGTHVDANRPTRSQFDTDST